MIINLDLKGRKIAVVGDGSDAIYRAKKMASEGASVTLFSDVVTVGALEESPTDRQSSSIKIEPAKKIFGRTIFARKRVADFTMIVATDRKNDINIELAKRARRYNILLNTLDEPATCNFSHVAVKEPIPGVEVAISTGGRSPAFASHLARKINSTIDEIDHEVFEAFVEARQEVKSQGRSTFEVDWKEIAAEIERRHRQKVA
ncbi:MAG: hypothetical protein M0Z45_06735 [Actinomycetota bacterium]|nr:hypothetical protein [Actinomycetota bacterium]